MSAYHPAAPRAHNVPIFGATLLAIVLLVLLHAPVRTRAQDRDGGEHTSPDVQRQLEELRQMIENQNREIEDLRRRQDEEAGAPPTAPRTEVPISVRKPEDSGADVESAFSTTTGPFQVGYDKGFVIQPVDREKTPFRLRITGRMQFRHTAFVRDEKHYTDNAGNVIRVDKRNDFEIERGRLTFDGFALDPKLGYFINFDFDTDDEHDVVIHDFWVYYLFNDAFILYAGKAFVPGSREWLMGSTTTRFADRSLATTFFRPDRSLGIWLIGEPINSLYYRTMLANGFNTTDLTVDDIDTNFTWASSVWWDVFDNWGGGWSDLEGHTSPAVQAGTSFTLGRQSGKDGQGQPRAEQNFVRLSDGTRLVATGALAPGVTVDEFDIYLYAVDLAAKYMGFSLNGEYYFRWIEDLGADGPLPRDGFFDHGFYIEGGYMLIAKTLELNARTSQIFGEYGDLGAEYGGGINWFINGAHNWKLSFDCTRVVDSPAQNSAPGYNVGDDGVLLRTQLQVGF